MLPLPLIAVPLLFITALMSMARQAALEREAVEACKPLEQTATQIPPG